MDKLTVNRDRLNRIAEELNSIFHVKGNSVDLYFKETSSNLHQGVFTKELSRTDSSSFHGGAFSLRPPACKGEFGKFKFKTVEIVYRESVPFDVDLYTDEQLKVMLFFAYDKMYKDLKKEIGFGPNDPMIGGIYFTNGDPALGGIYVKINENLRGYEIRGYHCHREITLENKE